MNFQKGVPTYYKDYWKIFIFEFVENYITCYKELK